MPLPIASSPPLVRTTGKTYRIRSLKRGDRDAAFELLKTQGWMVSASDQDLAVSWVVQHPEVETFVAHDAAAFSRIFAMLGMSHRPQLKLGGRVACIDLFLVAEGYRHQGMGTDLLDQALRRAANLGCKRMEISLPDARDGRHEFFEQSEFSRGSDGLFVRTRLPILK
jgi:GNAT superfamily N-acetyltransferase